MNSKALVLIIFAAWSALCWRWYVCGIKEACNKKPSVETPNLIQTQPIQRDTLASEAIQPETAPNSATSTQNNVEKKQTATPSAKPFKPSNIDQVQMERVKDYMVIHFPYNSVRREDNDAIDAYLTQLASELKSSGKKVHITGHTDFVGEAAANIQFGLKRANSIRDMLIKKGVKKSQIICKSLGDKKPVATNDTPQGRYKNRRVEISVGK
ncbi:MAG: OmpA family protein [Bacteroidota bacterium]